MQKIKDFFLKIWHFFADEVPPPESNGDTSSENVTKALADPNNPGSVMNQTTKLF